MRSGWHDVRANRTASALNSGRYGACVCAPLVEFLLCARGLRSTRSWVKLKSSLAQWVRTHIELWHTVPRHYILNPATNQIRATTSTWALSTPTEQRDRHIRSADFRYAQIPTMSCPSPRVRPPGDGYVVEGDRLVSQATTRLICRRFQANLRSNSPRPRGGLPTHRSPPSGPSRSPGAWREQIPLGSTSSLNPRRCPDEHFPARFNKIRRPVS